MRCALKVIPILKCARFALIAIHREIARPFSSPHKPPFFARREPGTTKPAQATLIYKLLNSFPIAVTAQGLKLHIAAIGTIGVQLLIIGDMRMCIPRRDRCIHLVFCRMVNVVMPDFKHRRRVTPPHTWRPQHPHLGRVKPVLQGLVQRIGTSQFAGQRVAHPNGQCRRWRFIFMHHVKMGIKGRHLIDFGLTKAQLFSQRRHMRQR